MLIVSIIVPIVDFFTWLLPAAGIAANPAIAVGQTMRIGEFQYRYRYVVHGGTYDSRIMNCGSSCPREGTPVEVGYDSARPWNSLPGDPNKRKPFLEFLNTLFFALFVAVTGILCVIKGRRIERNL
jgi:hypothetical protein